MEEKKDSTLWTSFCGVAFGENSVEPEEHISSMSCFVRALIQECSVSQKKPVIGL
jgi:hypothetical protein